MCGVLGELETGGLGDWEIGEWNEIAVIGGLITFIGCLTAFWFWVLDGEKGIFITF